jgi:hypothetical protein
VKTNLLINLAFAIELPDGIFAYQKSRIWFILGGLGMQRVGIFHGHLVYSVVIWYNLW